MKKERKIELLSCFPAVPVRVSEQMQGKGAMNYVVLLAGMTGKELFVRCYHRYTNGQLIERQRYVFAEDGCVRYGKDDNEPWKIRSDFREPVFCQSNYGYTFDNSYCVINVEAIKRTFMKYAPINTHSSILFIEYLRLCCKHPNFEYLVKQNYDFLVTEMYSGYWGTRQFLQVSPYINWKSNNLLKMLGLNRSEFKALQGQEKLYESYRMWRDRYGKSYNLDKLLLITKAFGMEVGTGERFAGATGLKLHRIARYLNENNVNPRDYSDYIEQCRDLKYDLCDTAISMPRDFQTMHVRLSELLREGENAEITRIFKENYTARKILNFGCEGSLFIRQPETFSEIVYEGKILNHCVGGYAQRHALGKLHIMFIRQREEPAKPFYTVEVSTSGQIVQVRGFKNSAPPAEVAEFVDKYKTYLEKIFRERKIV